MDRTLLLVVAGALAIAFGLGFFVAGLWRTFKAKREASKLAKHGLKSEKDAEKLLKKLGYQLVQKKPPASYWAVVDGEPKAFNVAGDLLLEKDGQSFIAEVKTGKSAKLENEATRRQILEYQLAFGVDNILLVDMDTKNIRTIRFPLPKSPGVAVTAAKKKKAAKVLLAAAALAGVAVWLVVRAATRSDDPLADTVHAADVHSGADSYVADEDPPEEE